MSNINRQNSLLAAEDWKSIYQGLTRAEFKSYDLENLNRVMIAYIREKFPEHFNDYTQSSEYLALINMISFIGQNLAYRQDLNARENTLELADRKDSVLRWAKVLCYRVKRNKPASGMLKFNSVSTTENLYDSNGRSLAGQTTMWNDPTNSNWYEQFTTIINAALPALSKIGNPEDSVDMGGLKCEQYRFNGTNTQVPLYSFSRAVNGRTMNFEAVSTVFKGKQVFYEESPRAGRNMAFVYTTDGRGAASSNTGFFLLFKQGTLQNGNFNISNPIPNNRVDISTSNINDSDVWLYSVDSFGNESDEWMRVIPSHGENIIYNSSENSGKIFMDETRTNDQITLTFADGVFGNIPNGNMRVYYRVSNGLNYVIQPSEITSVQMTIPYVSSRNTTETLTVSLSLKTAVSNSSPSESANSIKTNAPASYYTQNRMISGEDYNLFPATIDQEILKTKSINRVSAGISRYFDLKDVTGTHSSTNLIGKDGILYLDDSFSTSVVVKESNTMQYATSIQSDIKSIMDGGSLRDFYFREYAKWLLTNERAWKNCKFNLITNNSYATGYIKTNSGQIASVGQSTSGITDIDVSSMLKIKYGTESYIWVKVTRVYSNGLGTGNGLYGTDVGAIFLNDTLPALKNGLSSYEIVSVIPRFNTTFDDAITRGIISNMDSRVNFGVRYVYNSGSWSIVDSALLNTVAPYSSEASTSPNSDTSWLVSFEYTGGSYIVTTRGVRYVFESASEIRFFYDKGKRAYDSITGKITKDTVSILSVNPKSTDPGSVSIGSDVVVDVVDNILGVDGYVDDNRISISGVDSDLDGIVDNPSFFDELVSETDVVFWKKYTDGDYTYFQPYSTYDNITVVYTETEKQNCTTEYCYYSGNVYKKQTTSGITSWIINYDYVGRRGRNRLLFQYIHVAGFDDRIDPSPSNIMDIYLLTKTYDIEYRKWVDGILATEPIPPSSDELRIQFDGVIRKVKAISDEIVYHPARFKPIFGSKASPTLQATFLVVKSYGSSLSDNDIKTGVLYAINSMFASGQWNFGETFHIGELVAYIIKKMSPDVSNVVITPKQPNMAFGSLFEIKSKPNEILISVANVDDIQIVSDVTTSILTSQTAVF